MSVHNNGWCQSPGLIRIQVKTGSSPRQIAPYIVSNHARRQLARLVECFARRTYSDRRDVRMIQFPNDRDEYNERRGSTA
jgi:hypothetical protein